MMIVWVISIFILNPRIAPVNVCVKLDGDVCKDGVVSPHSIHD